MRGVRQSGKSGDRVDGSVEDQLGPLCRPSVVERFGLQSACYDQVSSLLDYGKGRVARFKRAHPGSRIQLVLNVRVNVSRAAHEGRAANQLPARMFDDD